MSEPMKSCETCKWHQAWDEQCLGGVQKHTYCLKAEASIAFGQDGCAYEPINNIELPASRVTQEGYDG